MSTRLNVGAPATVFALPVTSLCWPARERNESGILLISPTQAVRVKARYIKPRKKCSQMPRPANGEYFYPPDSHPPLETATLETAIGKTRRADVLATIGGHRYGIEIRGTHAKNQAARDDYADANLEAFEIDLSKTPHDVNRYILEQMLLDGADRHWLFKRGMARRRAASPPISPMPPPTRPDS